MNGRNFPARTEHWTLKLAWWILVYNFWAVVCCIPGRESELWVKGGITDLSKRMESGYSMQMKYNQSGWRKDLRLSQVFSFTELCTTEKMAVSSEYRHCILFVKLQITNWLWERYSRHCLFMVYLWLLLPFRLSFSFLKEKGSFHLCKEWLCKWFFISCSYLHRSINSAINFKRTVIPIKFVVFLGQVRVTGFYHGSNPYNQTQVVNYTQNTGQF